MIQNIRTYSLILICGLLVVACKKYPEGGYIYKRDTDIQRQWYLTLYEVDGIDSTDLINYNKSETEIIEQIQTLAWQSTDWLSLEIGHSNTGPIFSPAGERLVTTPVSIDNSVISVGFEITNHF